jgi:hypothetical protein
MTIDEAEDRYMNGGCAAFAYALWLAHGSPADAMIGLLCCDDNEPFSDDIPFDCTHAYLDMPDYEMDVAGRRSPDEMADDLYLDSCSLNGPYAPDEFLRTFVAMAPGQDLPLGGSAEAIAEALAFIQEHPERYQLS